MFCALLMRNRELTTLSEIAGPGVALISLFPMEYLIGLPFLHREHPENREGESKAHHLGKDG